MSRNGNSQNGRFGWRRSGLTALFAAALACLLPSAARAQSAVAVVKPPAPNENGIKVGEGRLHPYFDLEQRFDSAAISSFQGIFPDLVTHFRPGLTLDVPGNAVAVSLAGDIDYVLYTGLLTQAARSASHLEGAADLDTQFNRDGAVEVRLRDHFARSDRSNNPALAVGVLSLYNQVEASLPIHPGGHALEVTPGAAFTVEFFDPLLSTNGCNNSPACNPSTFNYTNVGFSLNGRYKFLPKTALVVDTNFQMPQFTGTGAAAPLLLRATAGLSGLITPKVSLLATVGWGYNFATDTPANTVLGHLELAWLASESASLRVGYLRSLEPVAIYNIYGDDRAYVEGRALLGGKLTVHGYGAFDLLSFYGNTGGADTNVTVDVGPDYQFTPWFIGGAGYTLTVRGSQRANQLNFARNEGYVRLTLTY